VATRDETDLWKLAVARSDLLASRDACEHLLAIEEPPYTLHTALLAAIVISYGRPFSQNRPHGPLPRRWHRFENKRHGEVHRIVLRMRDKLIAHSDIAERRVFVVPPGVDFPLRAPPDGKTAVVVRTATLVPSLVEEIRDLCLDLGRRINAEVDAVRQRAFPDDSLPDKEIELLP
jgi:hypothetical protein